MKKVLAMLLAAAMVFAGLGVPADSYAEEAADLTGEWYLNKMVESEQEYDASTLSMIGMSAILTLSEDGTGSLEFMGEANPITWSYENGEGAIVAEEDSIPLTVEDGMVVLAEEADSMYMYFTREIPEVEEVTLGEVIPEPQLADFNGNWEATSQSLFGMVYPISVIDTVITLEIQDGQVTYHSSSPSVEYEEEEEEVAEEELEAAEEELEEELEDALEGNAAEEARETVYTVQDFTIQAELVDGALVFSGGEAEDYVSMSLHLHDDGKMTDGYELPAEAGDGEEEDGDMSFYTVFEKAE